MSVRHPLSRARHHAVAHHRASWTTCCSTMRGLPPGRPPVPHGRSQPAAPYSRTHGGGLERVCSPEARRVKVFSPGASLGPQLGSMGTGWDSRRRSRARMTDRRAAAGRDAERASYAEESASGRARSTDACRPWLPSSSNRSSTATLTATPPRAGAGGCRRRSPRGRSSIAPHTSPRCWTPPASSTARLASGAASVARWSPRCCSPA